MWIVGGILYLLALLVLLSLLCVCFIGIAFIIITIGLFVEKVKETEGIFHKIKDVLDDWYW